MPSSEENANRIRSDLNASQTSARVVYTGGGVYSVDVAVSVGGASMLLEMGVDEDGLLWQLRGDDGPLVGGSRSDVTVDRAAGWALALLAHLGGRPDEPFFQAGDRVLVPGEAGGLGPVITVHEAAESSGSTYLLDGPGPGGRWWPTAGCAHAVPLGDGRAGRTSA